MPIDADDFRHPLENRPHARESIFYNIHLPEHGISGFFYTWVDQKDKAGYLVTLYGDKGERLVYDHHERLAAKKQDFDNWTLGGLSIRHTKALEVAEIVYQGETSMVELNFSALHRAFSYAENTEGCPQWLADDRWEQSGAIEGRMVVNGQRIDFNTTAHRDHSWGTRDWDSVQHWKWISGQAGNHLTFNAFQGFALGELLTNGYVNRGGNVYPITSIAVDSEFDDDFHQSHVKIRLRAEDGHTVEAEVDRFAILPFAPGGGIVMHEAGCAGQAGGRDAIVHVEMGWPKTYVAHQAEVRAAGA